MFYGGARGGGKSGFLLADFLNGANDWGEDWNGILFRQTYSQLDEIIRRAKQIYIPLGAEFHKAENSFVFPGGAAVKFRYLESDEDCEDCQGHSYTWIGFDELGNYRSDYAWTAMLMCLRSARVSEDWLRIRGTGNPGGVGHRWLKERFVEGREPGKVYAVSVGTGADGKPAHITRAFVPATVHDNEALLKMDPRYLNNLTAQPERMRQAMLEGRWDIKGGGEFFDEFDAARHTIPPRILAGERRRFYALDWGYKKPYAAVKLAVDKEGRVIVYGEIYGQGKVDGVEKENAGSQETAEAAALKCASAMAAEGVTEMIADYSCWDKDNGITSVADFFMNAGIVMIKSNKDRKRGWQLIHDLLREKDMNGDPMLRIFTTCKYLIREMETIQCDRNNVEDCDSRMSDHALDALRYGLYSHLYGYGGKTNAPVRAGGERRGYVHDPVSGGAWRNQTRSAV